MQNNHNKTMKTLFSLAILTSLFVSCEVIDVSVDKSQIKYEDEFKIIVPSAAVTPVVNAEEVNKLIVEQVGKASSKSLDPTVIQAQK